MPVNSSNMDKSIACLKTYNQLVRLSKKQRKAPNSVTEDFFSTYHLQDLRRHLWEWLCAALTNNDSAYSNGRDRSELLFLYENVEKLIEASFLISRRDLSQKNAVKTDDNLNP